MLVPDSSTRLRIREPGKTYPPNPERVWRFWPETMAKVIADDLVIWPDEAGGRMERPRFKTYFDPNTSKPKPVSSWIETANTNDREIEEDEAEYEVSILTSGMTQEGGKLLQQMMGSKVFAYPKPLSLVRSLIRAATRDDDLDPGFFCRNRHHRPRGSRPEPGRQRRAAISARGDGIRHLRRDHSCAPQRGS